MKKSKKKQKTNRLILIVVLFLIIIYAAFKSISNGEEQNNQNTDNQNFPNQEQNEESDKNDNGNGQEQNNQVENENNFGNENNSGNETPDEENKFDLSLTLGENDIVTNASSVEVVVNKSRYLPSDYVPGDLVSLNDLPTVLSNPEVNQLRKSAHDALKDLFSAAKKEGHELKARSGYRSYNTQESLYQSYVAKNGQEAADKFSAKPGQSEHQTGLAIDITAASMNFQLDDSFIDTKEGMWVKENAHKYGFIVRYLKDKENITGYMYEPWHLRYVGKQMAEEVYESGLTLEEFFQLKAEQQ